jgi:hypothetical protein
MSVQSDFRPGKSTVEQIATVRSIVEARMTRHKTVSLVSVDFRKAFDSVDRTAMADILSACGAPQLLVAPVMEPELLCSWEMTEPRSSRVFQGDTLAPFLFITVLDYVLRRSLWECVDVSASLCRLRCVGFVVSRRKSRRHPAITLAALAFADDIAVMQKSCSSSALTARAPNQSEKN